MALHRSHGGRAPGGHPGHQRRVSPPAAQHHRPGRAAPGRRPGRPRRRHRAARGTASTTARTTSTPAAGTPASRAASSGRLSTWWSPGTSAPPADPGGQGRDQPRQLGCPRAGWPPGPGRAGRPAARRDRPVRGVHGHRQVPAAPVADLGVGHLPPARRRSPASGPPRPPAGAPARSSPKMGLGHRRQHPGGHPGRPSARRRGRPPPRRRPPVAARQAAASPMTPPPTNTTSKRTPRSQVGPGASPGAGPAQRSGRRRRIVGIAAGLV